VHIAPGVPGAPVGAPGGKMGDSDTDSGKGNLNAVQEKDGQENSSTDNSRNENKDGNEKIVPGKC